MTMEAAVLEILPNARAFDGLDGYLCPNCDAWSKNQNMQRIMKCESCGSEFYLPTSLRIVACAELKLANDLQKCT